MPIKKKKISELNEASDLKGFYTIGYRIVDGVKESVKYGLEKIQNLYENLVKSISDAQKATTDVRQLEATVQENEEVRETSESQRNASEQSRQTAEVERGTKETKRIAEETKRDTAETERGTAEAERKEAEGVRVDSEEARATAESERSTAEQERKAAEEARVLSSQTAVNNATEATIRLNNLSDHRDEIRDGYWWHWNEGTEEYENTGEQAKGNTLFASFDIDPITGELSCTTDEEYTGASFSVENGDLTVTV